MGFNALVAALLSMYLDETRYKPTLETVERSEKNSEKDVDPSQAATSLPHNPDVWILFIFTLESKFQLSVEINLRLH